MKRFTLTRAYSTQKATLGILQADWIDNDPIFVLENPKRKTSLDSLIQAGIYLCKPYSGAIFKNVWILEDVPGRTAILIHAGNREQDTLGCLILGLQAGCVKGDPFVMQSKAAIEYFRTLVGNEEFELIIS